MIYKINLDKKKEFEKWNLKQILKHVLPLIIPCINWSCFDKPEQLKVDLENIANRIGTYKKTSVSIETPETKVKFNSKFYIILTIIIIIEIVIRVLK